MSIDVTAEMFLSEYFLGKAVLGKYLSDDKELFSVLSKICLIPEEERGKLYDLAENETAKKITTDKEYMQHRRLQKYSVLMGEEQTINAVWEEIVKLKGNAIILAHENHLAAESEGARNGVYTNLSAAAASGSILALRMIGILQCEGIFFEKNKEAGLKNLAKAADWNDGIGILALLFYNEEGRWANVIRLKQVMTDTPFFKLYRLAEKKYGVFEGSDAGEAKLLQKAFNSGVLKRETYEPKYARILNSKVLYLQDKERAMFTQNKEKLCNIGDLPLKLVHKNILPFDYTALEDLVVKRKRETSAIVCALDGSGLRAASSYRPLCICSESMYLLNLYAKALFSLQKGVHSEKLNVAELSEYEFEPTQNNIFVRNIAEDKDNRFLLFFCGEISERKMDAINNILQSARRTKFHLINPGVTLNLGAILPICFCDKRNLDALKPYCDVVEIAPLTREETSCALNEILKRKQKSYNVAQVELRGAPSDVFAGYDIDTAERMIDAAIRAYRANGAKMLFTREILEEFVPCGDQPKMGFGGQINGRSR